MASFIRNRQMKIDRTFFRPKDTNAYMLDMTMIDGMNIFSRIKATSMCRWNCGKKSRDVMGLNVKLKNQWPVPKKDI